MPYFVSAQMKMDTQNFHQICSRFVGILEMLSVVQIKVMSTFIHYTVLILTVTGVFNQPSTVLFGSYL